jgi:hypothetical protein
MYSNQNFQRLIEFKLKRPLESDSVTKDKRYNLGEWLHGDYKKKHKKVPDRKCNLHLMSSDAAG